MSEQKTVLCVEDDNTIRMLLCEELAFAGYRVLQARDGAEGLTVIREQQPDLVVCDVSMPRMSGFELLEAVNASSEDPVAHGHPYMTAIQAGIQGYPLPIGRILDGVVHQVGKNQP